MAAFAMPMLIINMGGEMVYILAQRLQAQNVPLDKSKRVLQDVIRTMYNPMFIAELFRPQDVYSMQSTRQIFDRLAHSSIMRLNESSMDKVRAAANHSSGLSMLNRGRRAVVILDQMQMSHAFYSDMLCSHGLPTCLAPRSCSIS